MNIVDEKLKIIESALELSLLMKMKSKEVVLNDIIIEVNDMKFKLSSDALYNFAISCKVPRTDGRKSVYKHLLGSNTIASGINLLSHDIVIITFKKDSPNYKSFSFVNNADSKYTEYEAMVDAYTYDGRIITEEEHFQSSLLLPNLPEYNTLLMYLEFMKYCHSFYGNEMNGRAFSYFLTEEITLEVLEELKKQISSI